MSFFFESSFMDYLADMAASYADRLKDLESYFSLAEAARPALKAGSEEKIIHLTEGQHKSISIN
jgi:hypothetical protein